MKSIKHGCDEKERARSEWNTYNWITMCHNPHVWGSFGEWQIIICNFIMNHKYGKAFALVIREGHPPHSHALVQHFFVQQFFCKMWHRGFACRKEGKKSHSSVCDILIIRLFRRMYLALQSWTRGKKTFRQTDCYQMRARLLKLRDLLFRVQGEEKRA